MNLEAQPWIADFRISVALDIFFLAVFMGLGGCLLLFMFSEFSILLVMIWRFLILVLGRAGDGFCVFRPADPPPLRAGAGLCEGVTY